MFVFMAAMGEEEVEGGVDVLLHVYDLSVGIAKHISPFLLGKQLEGIWHTGVVVYGKEFYFGHGINTSRAGETPFQRPHQVINMGKTHVPEELVEEMLVDLSETFTPESYSLMKHNCNHFSNEVRPLRFRLHFLLVVRLTHTLYLYLSLSFCAWTPKLCMFLVGKGIPDHIVRLPEEVLSSPFGMLLQPILDQMEATLSSVGTDRPFPSGFGGPGGFGAGQGQGVRREGESEPASGSSAGGGEGEDSRGGARDGGSAAGQQPPREPESNAEAEAEPETPSLREAFESLVKSEFERLVKDGLHTAQEAAVLALSLAREIIEGEVTN